MHLLQVLCDRIIREGAELNTYCTGKDISGIKLNLITL